jgi:uncharacterized protein (TIGR03437 family)
LSHTLSADPEYHCFVMKRSRFHFPISAGAALALIISFAPVAPAQTTGYWQYVKTETYTWKNPNGAYLDKSTGIEGAFTLVIESNDQYHASLGATFWWSRPPAILIPGTVIDWPLAAQVTQNVSGRYYILNFGAGFYAYAPIADLYSVWVFSATSPGSIGLKYDMPVNTTVASNNAQLANPAKVPGSGVGNASGLTSWLTHAAGHNDYFWSYVYQWKPGTPGACGGTCSLASAGQTAGISGATGSVAVTANSTWDVIAVAPWITVTSAASGTGNGTVTFTAAANTGAARSGSILIGGQTYTVHQNGVAAGTTAGCSYLIQSSTTQTVTTAAGTGMIQIITGQNCAWTAASNASWLTIKSGSSGTGNGAISYAVTVNDTGVARSGSIVMAGQVVAVNQAGGAVAGTPFISAGGVVNTASYAAGGPPNGSLAQGSYFSIYGSDVGPETGVKADTYPLPKTLGGVIVRIASGSTTYDAPLVFVSKGQINAIIPSTVPVGSARLTIIYGGKTSIEAPIIVAKTSVGVFFQRVNGKDLAIAQNVASATDYPVNLPSVPAKPGQIVILWGTGMGPISGKDDGAPGGGDMTSVPVTITVGGIAAPRLYAGRQPETAAVDNIYFTVPSGIVYSCQVPVAVTAGGVVANTTYIAITADGSPCQ